MANIKQFLADNNLRQVDLARFLGITEPSVSKMVKGQTNPSKENLRRMLENGMGWDTSSLLRETARPERLSDTESLRVEVRRLKDEVDRLLAIIERLTASVTPLSPGNNGRA